MFPPRQVKLSTFKKELMYTLGVKSEILFTTLGCLSRKNEYKRDVNVKSLKSQLSSPLELQFVNSAVQILK